MELTYSLQGSVLLGDQVQTQPLRYCGPQLPSRGPYGAPGFLTQILAYRALLSQSLSSSAACCAPFSRPCYLPILLLLSLPRCGPYPPGISAAHPIFPNQPSLYQPSGQYYRAPSFGLYACQWFCQLRPWVASQCYVPYHRCIPATHPSCPNQPDHHQRSGQYYPPPPPPPPPVLHVTYDHLCQQQRGGCRYVMIGAAVAVCCGGLGYVLGSFMGGLGRKGSLLSVLFHKVVVLVVKIYSTLWA